MASLTGDIRCDQIVELLGWRAMRRIYNLHAQRDSRVSWAFKKAGQKFLYVDLPALEAYLVAAGEAWRLCALARRVDDVRRKGNFFSPTAKWE